MSSAIVECVPNFSEGRDAAKIKAMTEAIAACPGVKLLDVDPGADTNRTVVTFVGSPQSVVAAAFAGIAMAAKVIDMRTHSGAHPRMGATDVCPFVPVQGVTLDDCAQLARELGARVGAELGIPVYLYEAAATRPERCNLASIRKGEYEGLAAKLADPQWQPDFGPSAPNLQSGATVIGAREFLIAYNVTLNTRDKALATDIAFELREKGRVARMGSGAVYGRGKILTYQPGALPCGNCGEVAADFETLWAHCKTAHHYDLTELLRANDIDPYQLAGQKVYRAGLFRDCKAIGWYVDTYKRAQISINLTNWRVTPPHVVLEAARKLATERGLVVTGSEIVGLVPYAALLEAGRYYLRQQGRSPHVPVADLLETAVFSMGLADVAPFELAKKVIGLPEDLGGKLVGMRVADFVDEVGRDTPAPGGGSIAALCGSLGAALASMVANLTHAKPEFAEQAEVLLDIASQAQTLSQELAAAVDADTDAFNAYLAARRLPQATASEIEARAAAMQDGLQHAVRVPLRTAEASLAAMRVARLAVDHGNPASLTDGAVGNAVAWAGVRGGVWNVLINLKEITDAEFVAQMRQQCTQLVADADALRDETAAQVDGKLSQG